MITLSTDDATELVRKNLDELDPNSSIMYDDENGSTDAFNDNNSMDLLIAMNLPEAINAVHQSAPAYLLEGVNHPFASQDAVSISGDGILTLTLSDDFLRLVAFRAADSLITLTNLTAEDSPEGRKQLNGYIRGRADKPVLVKAQGKNILKYYSLTDAAQYVNDDENAGPNGATLPFPPDPTPVSYAWWPNAIADFTYVKRVSWDEEITDYSVSAKLKQNIIDYLTGMVLETYSDHEKAQYFFNKAITYPTI